MKIPEGMTEQQVIDVIYNVARRLARKYRFGYHDIKDIEQEAVVFAIQGLTKYNSKHPLENFLYIHVRNRLFNYKRKNYMRPNSVDNANISKRNIMCPINLDEVSDEHEDNMKVFNDIIDDVIKAEVLHLIDSQLPVKFRADYSKMKNGIKIPKAKQREIEAIIIEILEENGYGR